MYKVKMAIVVLFWAATALGQSVTPGTQNFDLPDFAASELAGRQVPDDRVRSFVLAKRVVWTSETGVDGADRLLLPVAGQTSTAAMNDGCHMEKTAGADAAILLDFGRELHGGLRLESRNLTPGNGSYGKSVRIRVRFGESADEAMAEPGEKGAVVEHSARDMIVNVPWLGAVEFGESAFRFARLDLLDDGAKICFDSVRAVFVHRNLQWLGSFRCSDPRLNDVWNTAAWTQFLTMQGYIIEGAKRDRLVWYGDFHPQAMTTLALFGAVPVLTDSLGTYARETWPLPKWMNGMPNYSLWWLITVSDVVRYSGNLDWLREQQDYIKTLVDQLLPHIADDGRGGFDNPFLDWPTHGKREALDAGTHAMFLMAFHRVRDLANLLQDASLAGKADDALAKLGQYQGTNQGNKQAAALMACAGQESTAVANGQVVAKGGGQNFSTFYGYYMLEALAKTNQKQVALDVIRQYWGAMLDVGATTFWEDFDLAWLKNAGRIDELTPDGKESLHGDRGAFCYIGLRHSLCHGWSSGPTPWIQNHILGVEPVSPGFKEISFQPFLGDLDWAEGTIPTPHGLIRVRLDKNADGTIKSDLTLPDGVRVIP
ncbi:MAG: alpha-L-rhamnosidase C-terminal domain-containing protein [Planctomycetia bacterium]|nr:alpha-L-rhamnosidase C-terminal domain-containing protein [Planctomycetia bacterium]